MPVAVWVQTYPLLRLLLWLPTMWAQKSRQTKNFQFNGAIGIEKVAN